MKSTDPREQEIHSLAAQLRDCRELLNQTNQELAALGSERATLATENEALRAQVELLEGTLASADREMEEFLQLRDYGEECFGRVLDLVLGDDREEWSSGYGFENAIQDVDEHMESLRVERDEAFAKAKHEAMKYNRLKSALDTVSVTQIKAAGAREALQRAMQTPGFSDTVVRVDALQAVIEQMEGEL